MPAAGYRGPVRGAVLRRMPLFTWDPVPGACAYYVIVARDAEFTNVVDVALTAQPAYAPRTGGTSTTYADETTAYHWAVLPTANRDGSGLSTQPQQNPGQKHAQLKTPHANVYKVKGCVF